MQKFGVLAQAVAAVKQMQTEGVVYKRGSRRYVILKELDSELHKVIRPSDGLKESA